MMMPSCRIITPSLTCDIGKNVSHKKKPNKEKAAINTHLLHTRLNIRREDSVLWECIELLNNKDDEQKKVASDEHAESARDCQNGRRVELEQSERQAELLPKHQSP